MLEVTGDFGVLFGIVLDMARTHSKQETVPLLYRNLGYISDIIRHQYKADNGQILQ